MFSGIIECVGKVVDIQVEETNLHFTILSDISGGSYIDQSISHNGVCLTVVKIEENTHTVTAIKQTLDISNLKHLKIDDSVNLERAVLANSRMDGHFVQGHVDNTLVCTHLDDVNGSILYTFGMDAEQSKLIVPKGSICINGVSLTVAQIESNQFTVAIIPYTLENTNFKTLRVGDVVNVEFDILGKYIVNFLNKMNT